MDQIRLALESQYFGTKKVSVDIHISSDWILSLARQ